MRRIVSQLILWPLLSAVCPFYACGQQYPCPDGPNVSNTEMRECYTKAQAEMNKKADEIAARIAENLRTISPKEKDLYGSVIIQLLDDAAQKIGSSQTHWRAFRDDYCNAIGSSYMTGSGAGTAYEQCLYRTAAARVHQLLDDFPNPAVVRAHPH
jgi:uncharacterized protein YecT (DUF1311 family)